LPKIVAHELNIPIENVEMEIRDTGKVPDSGPTVASRTTMIVGGLLQKAAAELKARWHESETLEISKVYKHPDYLQWNNDTFEGDAYPTYSWGVNVVELSVNPITYELNLEKITAVYDVGAVIDERALRGQMQGGIAQGAGWATIEVMQNREGKLLQKNLTDYKIPTSMDIPEIHCEFIDNPYHNGPFGAKCAGELPFVGPAPAIAAAVSHALNKKITKIPIRPEALI
jgi:CO/xanthine dehydrogenase Mo-binding subunit